MTLSLLGQAFKKLLEGNSDKGRQLLSYIVGNFTRIAGASVSAHPLICEFLAIQNVNDKDFANALTNELFVKVGQYQESEEGVALATKLTKEAISVSDIYNLYYYIVLRHPIFREVIGLPAFADVVNGACGQYFNNVYQGRCIPAIYLDDHQLLIEKCDDPAIYMASRWVQGAQAFDAFLLAPFIKNDINHYQDQEQWLAACTNDLRSAIFNLHGLCSAILIRHIMGESSDLGPDNMLLVNDGNAQYLVNIDVTGFRYKRRKAFEDKTKNATRYGWEDTLITSGRAALIDHLFNSSVFCSRFVDSSTKLTKELKPLIMNAIVSVLIEKVIDKVEAEVNDVKEWVELQNHEDLLDSLVSVMNVAYQSLNPLVKPAYGYFEKLLDYNKGFITEPVDIAKELAKESSLQEESRLAY